MFEKLFKKSRVLYSAPDSGFGEIKVIQCFENGYSMRLLLINNGRESATFNKRSKRAELVFKYTREFDRIFEGKTSVSSILMFGGAGFSYPKHILAHHRECTVDVVEINPQMPVLAKKYFYLKDSDRLKIHINDANLFLESDDSRFDVIINDAFIGQTMDSRLLETDRVKMIKDHLTDGGIYVINLITSLTGTGSFPLMMQINLLRKQFKNVSLVRPTPDRNPDERQNCLLFASD
ncbi:MAG: fused MFS/spermidine synthase, partial [Lachnospiraceae bacterium]|nr:fused MFS/spermidine synthase [Lachnospiraceae bacterium]